MKEKRGVSFEELLAKQLKNKEVRLLFDEKLFYLQVAHLVTELREKSGLSQAEVAKRAHVSQPLIARLEKGDHRRAPTFDMLYRILKVLGYSLMIAVKPERKAA